jgi:hypothetical protein
MSIIGKTIGALGNLTFVLVIIIFIFAVMGMQVNAMKCSIKEPLLSFLVIRSEISAEIWSRHASMEFLRFFSCIYVSKYRFQLIWIDEFLFNQGSFFVSYAVNGLNQCGIVLNVLVGHASHFFYLHLSLEILWLEWIGTTFFRKMIVFFRYWIYFWLFYWLHSVHWVNEKMKMMIIKLVKQLIVFNDVFVL